MMVSKTARDKFTESDDTLVVSSNEIREAIDIEARASLGITGEQFITQWRNGKMPYSAASWDIGILVSLLDHE